MNEEKKDKESSNVVPFRSKEAERPAVSEPLISVREIGSGNGRGGKTDLVIVTSGFPLPAPAGGKSMTCLAQAAAA